MCAGYCPRTGKRRGELPPPLPSTDVARARVCAGLLGMLNEGRRLSMPRRPFDAGCPFAQVAPSTVLEDQSKVNQLA